ncbi:MAG: hypothetical protein R2730_03925 [Chitinophagales bacterium]
MRIKLFSSNESFQSKIKDINPLLSSLLLKENKETFIFPFALFQKRFYRKKKKSRDRHFIGNVTYNKFFFENNLVTFPFYLNISIEGELQENEKDTNVNLSFFFIIDWFEIAFITLFNVLALSYQLYEVLILDVLYLICIMVTAFYYKYIILSRIKTT